jgi:hypothetical protein
MYMQKKIKKNCIRKMHTYGTKKMPPNSTSTTENRGARRSTFLLNFLKN